MQAGTANYAAPVQQAPPAPTQPVAPVARLVLPAHKPFVLSSGAKWGIAVGVILFIAIIATAVGLTQGGSSSVSHNPRSADESGDEANSFTQTASHEGTVTTSGNGTTSFSSTTSHSGSVSSDVSRRTTHFMRSGTLPPSNQFVENYEPEQDDVKPRVHEKYWGVHYDLHRGRGVHWFGRTGYYPSSSGRKSVQWNRGRTFGAEGSTNRFEHFKDFEGHGVNSSVYLIRNNDFKYMAGVAGPDHHTMVYENDDREHIDRVNGLINGGYVSDLVKTTSGYFAGTIRFTDDSTSPALYVQPLVFKDDMMMPAETHLLPLYNFQGSGVNYAPRQVLVTDQSVYAYVDSDLSGKPTLYRFDRSSGKDWNAVPDETIDLSGSIEHKYPYHVMAASNEMFVYYDQEGSVRVRTPDSAGKYTVEGESLSLNALYDTSSVEFMCLDCAGPLVAVMVRSKPNPYRGFVYIFVRDEEGKFSYSNYQKIIVSMSVRVNAISLSIRPEHEVAVLAVPMSDGSVEKFDWDYGPSW